MERCQNNKCFLAPAAETPFGEQLNEIKLPPCWAGSELVPSPHGDLFSHPPYGPVLPVGTHLRALLFCPAAFSPVPTRAPSSHNAIMYLNHGHLVREKTEVFFSSVCVGGERRERCRGSWYFPIINSL